MLKRPRPVARRVLGTSTAARAVLPSPKGVSAPVRPQFAPGSKLHIGCGSRRLPGWINADIVPGVGEVVLDLRDALPTGTFTEIYGCHVLEHCFADETPKILVKLRAALAPGGTLRLSVPDVRLVVENCLESHSYGGEQSALAVLYGGDFASTTQAQDRHYQIFWQERLTRLLQEAGFVEIETWGFGDCPAIDALSDYATWPRDAQGKSLISLNLKAKRPGGAKKQVSAGAGVTVSALLGTVNRRQMLAECIESIRRAVSGLTYEIVVAYGDNSEESLPWLLQQPDVVPVLGGMEGAIEAFNRAYAASSGKYICQLNDDVVVDDASISCAVHHLERDPAAAGVVFQFDRNDGQGYRHTYIGGAERGGTTLHPNQMVVRRSAAEAVIEHLGAFWGDAAHRTDKTYGGDSAFGVLCRHLGLRLDSVPSVTCRDRCDEANDALRARNAKTDPKHSSRWRELYGPLIDAPVRQPAATEWPNLYIPRPGQAPRRSPARAGGRLRVLHATLATEAEPLTALQEALSAIGPADHVRWASLGPRGMLAAVAERKPDLLFAQVQTHSFWSEPDFLRQLRAAAGPDCTLVHWTGDVRTAEAEPVERWLVPMGQVFDLMLADNTTYPRKLKAEERVPAACGYLGCGIDPNLNRWRPRDVEVPELGHVVFLGTNYTQLDHGARSELLERVAKHVRLRVYGNGWERSALAKQAHPFVSQEQAARVMRAARVTIATSLFHDLGRYSSDRLKRALCAGAVVAVRAFPDMHGLGLKDLHNCLIWDSPEALLELLKIWTAEDLAERRFAIRVQAAELARKRFTWPRVIEELLAIVRDYRERRGQAV